ncbi:MAG: hypothetical protein U1F52_11475 [Burkholderiales bacterium]
MSTSPCRRLLTATVLVTIASVVVAAPRMPVDDREVLEHLPSTPGDAQAVALRPWRAALSRDPTNLTVAVRVARTYVDIGRTTGDPRYAGYAEAALSPWWSSPDPPPAVRLLRAILRQRVHRFDAALADLDALIERNPRDAQARLTRATILQVQGRLDAAGRECDALRGLTGALYAETCTASVAGLHGDAAGARSRLEALVDQGLAADGDARAWVAGLLAELAERGGDVRTAERWYRTALSAAPDDPYLLAAYGDHLIDRGRFIDVIALLKDRLRADGLLLRYAVAMSMLRRDDAARVTDQLRNRFAASHRRGDRVHLREEARFALDLDRDPSVAVRLARENWAVQKEPADALVLLRAAIAARDDEARRLVERWQVETHLEDVRIDALRTRRDASVLR